MSETAQVGGMHAVKALLKSNAADTQELLIQKGRRDTRMRALVSMAQKAKIPVRELSRQELDVLANGIEHQGVLASVVGHPVGNEKDLFAHVSQQMSAPASEPGSQSKSEPEKQPVSQHAKKLLLLVLDGLQDPHNLGACIRSADAAGVDAVVMPMDNSVGITPVVRKVASGAVETVPIFQVTNLQRALDKLKAEGIWVYGAAGEADGALYDLDFKGHTALVLGSEGSGLRRLTREACDGLFTIPMHGTVGSLNVSVAAGISLFEVCRQRR